MFKVTLYYEQHDDNIYVIHLDSEDPVDLTSLDSCKEYVENNKEAEHWERGDLSLVMATITEPNGALKHLYKNRNWYFLIKEYKND